MNKRQLLAGTAAAVLTFGSAAAAIALNVGASSGQDTSPAGKLAATESVVTAPPVTPSTIYVDVTVPDLPPGSVPVTDSGTPGPVGSAGSAGSTGSTRKKGSDAAPSTSPSATPTVPGTGHDIAGAPDDEKSEPSHQGGGDDD
jgi:cytoskeletal protein RodZ